MVIDSRSHFRDRRHVDAELTGKMRIPLDELGGLHDLMVC